MPFAHRRFRSRHLRDRDNTSILWAVTAIDGKCRAYCAVRPLSRLSCPARRSGWRRALRGQQIAILLQLPFGDIASPIAAISPHRRRKHGMPDRARSPRVGTSKKRSRLASQWCRQTFQAEIKSTLARMGNSRRSGASPRSRQPISTPTIDPTAMTSTKARLQPSTAKLLSRL